MHGNSDQDGPDLVSNRTVEIVVALLFLLGSAIVIFDSVRLGFDWREGEGPAPGYFPFYIALFMAVASLGNLARAVLNKNKGGGDGFVSVPAFRRVLTILLPAIVYVVLIGGLYVGRIAIPGIGIYLASAIYIAAFMVWIGRETWIKAVITGVAVSLALFVLFEVWFLVPLPKGPIETMLGY